MIKDKQYWLNKRERKARDKIKQKGIHIHLTDEDLFESKSHLMVFAPHDTEIVKLESILHEDWVVKIERPTELL